MTPHKYIEGDLFISTRILPYARDKQIAIVVERTMWSELGPSYQVLFMPACKLEWITEETLVTLFKFAQSA